MGSWNADVHYLRVPLPEVDFTQIPERNLILSVPVPDTQAHVLHSNSPQGRTPFMCSVFILFPRNIDQPFSFRSFSPNTQYGDTIQSESVYSKDILSLSRESNKKQAWADEGGNTEKRDIRGEKGQLRWWVALDEIDDYEPLRPSTNPDDFLGWAWI